MMFQNIEWWHSFLTVVLAQLFVVWIYSYTKENAALTAKKEIIGEITKIEEKIKAGFLNEVEILKASYSYTSSLALITLEKHQEAFLQWRKLHQIVYSTDLAHKRQIIGEVHTWLMANCLYLHDDIFEAFAESIVAVEIHSGLVQAKDDPANIIKNFDTIKKPGVLLLQQQKFKRATYEKMEKAVTATNEMSKGG